MNHRPLEELFENYIEDEKNLSKKINTEEHQQTICALQITNRDLALFAMYVSKDLLAARNYFYKAALCGEYMVRNYDELMDTSIYKICCAVLSDNTEIMKRYGTLRNKVVIKNFIGYIFNTIIKAVIMNDEVELTTQIDKLKIATTKKGSKGFAGMINVFEGIRDVNKEQVEIGLKELIKTHGRRGEFGIAKSYFSFETATFAKLAWLRGIKVEVHSPLVPMEIVEVNELVTYEGYLL
ncbi:MAG: hypothetical protein ACOVQ4_02030 [Flectobacillus sp.]|uniref:hypothetical protein n=1 Tax=Flectobacillus sp. TaxID=50419 RepID=UPI003B9B7321